MKNNQVSWDDLKAPDLKATCRVSNKKEGINFAQKEHWILQRLSLQQICDQRKKTVFVETTFDILKLWKFVHLIYQTNSVYIIQRVYLR